MLHYETQSCTEWLKSIQNTTYLLSLSIGSNLVPRMKKSHYWVVPNLCVFPRSSFTEHSGNGSMKMFYQMACGAFIQSMSSTLVSYTMPFIACKCITHSLFAIVYGLLIIHIFYICLIHLWYFTLFISNSFFFLCFLPAMFTKCSIWLIYLISDIA